jgi:hypothetical protein
MSNKPLTLEENYKLMNSSDLIPTNWDIRPWATYVAFDFGFQIIAAGNYNKVYFKAVSRGCTVPHIENAAKILSSEQVKEHNNLLEKALSEKKLAKSLSNP